MPAQQSQRHAALVMNVYRVRLEPKRLVVMRDRVVLLPRRAQCPGQIGLCIRIARVQRQRLLKMPHCFVVTFQPAEHVAAVIVQRRIIRAYCQRLQKAGIRIRQPALLRQQHAQHMQRIEMAGLQIQHLAITRLGRRQIAALMGRQRGLETEGDFGRRRCRRDDGLRRLTGLSGLTGLTGLGCGFRCLFRHLLCRLPLCRRPLCQCLLCRIVCRF